MASAFQLYSAAHLNTKEHLHKSLNYSGKEGSLAQERGFTFLYI